MAFNAFIDNRTPFAANKFVIPDKNGQEVLILVVNATFERKTKSELQVAAEQSPIKLADEYYGEPDKSSVRYEADIAIEKPYVDILVNGHAYAPDNRPAEDVPVKIQIGDIAKQLMVSGDRDWSGFLEDSPSAATPFLQMPIIYERAFGGANLESKDISQQFCDVRNPVGIGFRDAISRDVNVASQLPNIEYVDDLIRHKGSRPRPAGLGVIGRGWQPRLKYAGTYDKTWLKEKWPLLPDDFDPRHYQSAPSDQQSKTIRGGEKAGLLNMTPDGLWTFRIPALNIPVRLYYDDRETEATLRMDTILIEPDHYRLTLTSRLAIKTVRNKGMLREIVLGHMSKGWRQAHTNRKRYHDHSGNGGVNKDMPLYYLGTL